MSADHDRLFHSFEPGEPLDDATAPADREAIVKAAAAAAPLAGPGWGDQFHRCARGPHRLQRPRLLPSQRPGSPAGKHAEKSTTGRSSAEDKKKDAARADSGPGPQAPVGAPQTEPSIPGDRYRRTTEMSPEVAL